MPQKLRLFSLTQITEPVDATVTRMAGWLIGKIHAGAGDVVQKAYWHAVGGGWALFSEPDKIV